MMTKQELINSLLCQLEKSDAVCGDQVLIPKDQVIQIIQALSGKKEITAVTLSPEVVDPDDIEMLQDLIIAAANEALKKMEEEQEGALNSVAGGLGSTLGGFGF